MATVQEHSKSGTSKKYTTIPATRVESGATLSVTVNIQKI